MRWLIALVACAGCDEIEGLKHLDTGFDRCAQQPFDVDRYALVADANHNRIDFVTAAAECAARGLQPITIDDEQEHTMLAGTIAGWSSHVSPGDRIFVGLSDAAIEGTWVNADDCPDPDLFWATGAGTMDTNLNCAALDSNGMLEDGSCVGDFDRFGNHAATAIACELPRWPNAGCVDAARTHGAFVFDPTPRARSDAQAVCAQQHGIVVELDSSGEIADANVAASGMSVWLGADKTTGAWTSATGCPQLLPWMGYEPLVQDGDCVVLFGGGAQVVPCSELHPTLCELGP